MSPVWTFQEKSSEEGWNGVFSNPLWRIVWAKARHKDVSRKIWHGQCWWYQDILVVWWPTSACLPGHIILPYNHRVNVMFEHWYSFPPVCLQSIKLFLFLFLFLPSVRPLCFMPYFQTSKLLQTIDKSSKTCPSVPKSGCSLVLCCSRHISPHDGTFMTSWLSLLPPMEAEGVKQGWDNL